MKLSLLLAFLTVSLGAWGQNKSVHCEGAYSWSERPEILNVRLDADIVNGNEIGKMFYWVSNHHHERIDSAIRNNLKMDESFKSEERKYKGLLRFNTRGDRYNTSFLFTKGFEGRGFMHIHGPEVAEVPMHCLLSEPRKY